MSASRFDFKSLIGEPFRRTITLKDQDGSPIDLSGGATVSMPITATTRPGAQVYATVSTADESIVITNPAGGVIALDLETVETAAFNFATAFYKLVVTFPGGNTETFLFGLFQTNPNAPDEASQTSNITVSGQDITVSVIGIEGPQGPPSMGAGGGSAPIGGTVAQGCAVVMIGGQLFRADPTNLAHAGKVVGIAEQTSSQIGAVVSFISFGQLNGFASSLTQDQPYWVGLNGVLSTTQKAVGAAWYQFVGFAQDSSNMVVEIGPAITIG